MDYNEWYQSGIMIVNGREFQIPPRHPVPALYDPDVIANRWVHRGYVQAWLNDNIVKQ